MRQLKHFFSPNPSTKRLLPVITLCFALSLIITAGVWLSSGRPLFSGPYLNLEFFNTLCGVFGIIGLLIALYQIAALKTEKELVFISRTAERLGGIMAQLEHYRSESRENPRRLKVKQSRRNAKQVRDFFNTVSAINNQQKVLFPTPRVDCDVVIRLLKSAEEKMNEAEDKAAIESVLAAAIDALREILDLNLHL